MQILEAINDVRIRVWADKLNLNKWDLIEVSDSDINFYLSNWFVKTEEVDTTARVLKTSNEETAEFLREKEIEAEEAEKSLKKEEKERAKKHKAEAEERERKELLDKSNIIDQDWNRYISQEEYEEHMEKVEKLQAKYQFAYGEKAPDNRFWRDLERLKKMIDEKKDEKKQDIKKDDEKIVEKISDEAKTAEIDEKKDENDSVSIPDDTWTVTE